MTDPSMTSDGAQVLDISSDTSTLSESDEEALSLPAMSLTAAKASGTASTETCSNDESIPILRPRRPSVGAKELHLASLAAKRDRTLIYDLGDGDGVGQEKRLGIMKWLNSNLPTRTRRSDGVGRIAVISGRRTEEDLTGLDDIVKREGEALKDWKAMLQEEGRTVTWKTFQELAAKHDVRGGKWIMHVSAAIVDDLWKKIAWALAYEKFPTSCIQVSVTPVEDSEQKTVPAQAKAPPPVDVISDELQKQSISDKLTITSPEAPKSITGSQSSEVPEQKKLASASSRDHNVHVIALWNVDFMQEDEVLAVESSVRKLGVRLPMTYKPDIFSAVGVYRNNDWKLRPAIYSSRYNMETKIGSLESGIDPGWRFVTGSE